MRQGRMLEGVSSVGDMSLLHRSLGLLCSTKCPGNVILKSYAAARIIRGTHCAVVSGFHSAIEKDCLDILLTGKGSIIICPARRLATTRLPRAWQEAIGAGRMLLLSPFDEKQKRATAKLAVERNRFVTSIANEILIAYAHPGSRTEALCREVLASGKRVYTFNDPANQHLIDMGAVPIEPGHFSTMASSSLDRNSLPRLP